MIKTQSSNWTKTKLDSIFHAFATPSSFSLDVLKPDLFDMFIIIGNNAQGHKDCFNLHCIPTKLSMSRHGTLLNDI